MRAGARIRSVIAFAVLSMWSVAVTIRETVRARRRPSPGHVNP